MKILELWQNIFGKSSKGRAKLAGKGFSEQRNLHTWQASKQGEVVRRSRPQNGDEQWKTFFEAGA